jgi:hypothetical protein
MTAWRTATPLVDSLADDGEVTAVLDRAALARLFDLDHHTAQVDMLLARVLEDGDGAR